MKIAATLLASASLAGCATFAGTPGTLPVVTVPAALANYIRPYCDKLDFVSFSVPIIINIAKASGVFIPVGADAAQQFAVSVISQICHAPPPVAAAATTTALPPK